MNPLPLHSAAMVFSLVPSDAFVVFSRPSSMDRDRSASIPEESQFGGSPGDRAGSDNSSCHHWKGERSASHCPLLRRFALAMERIACMLLLPFFKVCAHRSRSAFFRQFAILSVLPVALGSCNRAPDPGNAESLPEGTIATVGGVALLQNDLDYARTISGNRPVAEVLRTLTEEESLAQLAEREGLTQDPSVKAAMRRMLAARVREKHLATTVVSDAEVAAALDAARGVRPSAESLHLAFLRQTFETAGGAEAAKAKLVSARALWLALPPEQASKGFGSIAVTHSDDTDTRYQGGDGGWIVRGEPHLLLPKAATDAAALLDAPGLLPEILLAQDAAWLVAVLAIRQQPENRVSAEQIRLQLESAGRARQQEALIQRAAAAAPIKILATIPLQEASDRAESTQPPTNPP